MNIQAQIDEEVRKFDKTRERIFRFKNKSFEIKEIPLPKKVEPFQDTQAVWGPMEFNNIRVPSACYFWAPKEFVFDAHHHPEQEEVLQLQSGSITCYSRLGETTMVPGDAISFTAGMSHKVVWHKDSLISIIWRPPFKDDTWVAEV